MSHVDETTLLKLAEAEILGETKRAAVRYSTAGVSGWQPCPRTNKTFLTNTLLQTMASNRVLTRKKQNKDKSSGKHKTERKLLQKRSKTDIACNFVYQKPNKQKEKLIFSTKKHKCTNNSNNIKLEDNNSKNVKEIKQKINVYKNKVKQS